METSSKIRQEALSGILRNRHYLKNGIHISGLEFELQILLNLEATEVFISHLHASARLKHAINFESTYTTEIIINFEKIDLDFALEDLDFAYQKAIQYLDYKDLKKDYAAGYVPLYLSDWLITQN